MKSLSQAQAKQFGHVGVLMGGISAEREISLDGGEAVLEGLKRLGIDAIAIDVADNPIASLVGQKIDRVFNIIHGRGGEDGVLQGVLEAMKIPYTGSGVMASALTMDKIRTKICWQGAGLITPKWYLLEDEKDIDPCIEYLGFPVIVKPALEGSSLGMDKANNKDELKKAWLIATEYQCAVFAETWVTGEEYTIAVIEGEALPVIRLETPNIFYDYEAKYQASNTLYHCPCGLSKQQEDDLKKMAIKACSIVGVEGWGRVDVFLDETNVAQLIEVNTVPGMTNHSLVPMAAKANGIEFDELVKRVLETSLNE